MINGCGKYTWTNGKIYEGEWANNKMSGQGKMTWPDGKLYEGGFLKDKKHGQGKLIAKDGKVLEAEWEEGKCKAPAESNPRRSTKHKKSRSKESSVIV